MDTLPVELIPFVFNHLTLNDLAQCRLTCKKFRFFVDRTKLSELFINDEDDLITSLTEWHYTKREINVKNIINISNFNLLRSFSFDLTSLFRLIINFSQPYNRFDVNFVNRLANLQQLEIWNLGDPSTGWEDSRRARLNLKLDHLKIVYIGCVSLRLLIESSQIEVLFLYPEGSGFNSVEFSHPQSVKHLEFEHISDEDLRQFVNVETLKCCFSHSLSLDLLVILPHLKELACDQQELTSKANYDRLISTMNHLVEQKTLLARENLEIYFKKTKLLRTKKFEKYGFYSNLEIRILK